MQLLLELPIGEGTPGCRFALVLIAMGDWEHTEKMQNVTEASNQASKAIRFCKRFKMYSDEQREIKSGGKKYIPAW
jgi:hypothetical protein